MRSLLSQKQRDNFRKPERQSERPAEAGSAHRSAPPRRKGRPRFASFLSFQFLDQGMKGPEFDQDPPPPCPLRVGFYPESRHCSAPLACLVSQPVISTAAGAAASRYLPFVILVPDFKGTNFI